MKSLGVLGREFGRELGRELEDRLLVLWSRSVICDEEAFDGDRGRGGLVESVLSFSDLDREPVPGWGWDEDLVNNGALLSDAVLTRDGGLDNGTWLDGVGISPR